MLVAVLDVPRAPADWPQAASRCAPWVDVFILRAKTQPAATQRGLAARLVEAVGGRPVLVADRLDVAMALGVAGVHLPGDGLAPSDARRLWPSGVVSRAVHSVEDVDSAAGADWLVFGHLFPTRSKPGVNPRGLDLAAQVVRQSPVPVVGIGGVDPTRVAAVCDAGLAGVAVVDALWLAPDPAGAARELAAPWATHGGGT